MLTVRPARSEELDAIWTLVQKAVCHMNALGNPQWGGDYPTKDHYADDIARGELYAALTSDGLLLGVACVNSDESPEYAAVSWSVPGPALVVHRMAVDPTAQRQGVGKALFSHAEALARASGVRSLRVDTYGQNDRMQALLLGFGFQRVGEINLHGRPLKFPCFEKLLIPLKKLLIVVDYQADFVNGTLGFPGAELLDGPIAERVRLFHTKGDDVVFTADTHQSDYQDTQEGKKLPVAHCLAGTGGWALFGETGQSRDPERDLLMEKNTFPSLALANWLSGRADSGVELCGLVSHICVVSNAVMVKAALPEAEILVDARLTASYDPALHEKALDVLEGLHITVTNRTNERDGHANEKRP